jgi:hypothetical protein
MECEYDEQPSTQYIYFPPNNAEARRIWTECNLGHSATDMAVVERLRKWVYFNTQMYDRMTSTLGIIETAVRWTGPDGVRYDMTWTAFTKWFHCTCITNQVA